jgi:opacity protein-like surface antigen
MRFNLVFIFSFCLSTTIQAQTNPSTKDSFNYYQRQLSFIRRTYMDSLNKDVNYVEARNNLIRLTAQSDNYNAFVIYTNIASADFTLFNNANAQSNFTHLKEDMIGIGYGFSFKRNRRIFDLNISAFGIGKKSKKESEYIKTSFSTFLQLEWGYDFIKNKVVNIYPFLGVGLRSSGLRYNGSSSANANFTNVSNVIQNKTSVDETTTEIGYQAGLGIEYEFLNKISTGGVIIFAKAGTNNAFKKKEFKIEGLPYDPKFNYGKMNISFGVKFFGRR